MTQGVYQVIIIFTDKKQLLFAISVLNWVFTSAIQSPRFTNDYKFGITKQTHNIFIKFFNGRIKSL